MDDAISQSDQDVHVVVTCTNRKRFAVSDRLQLHNLGSGDVTQRCDDWVKRLADGSSHVPAKDMYAGEHWLIARGLAEAAGSGATLWICSAGYGLISDEAPIEAYAATFAARHKDSVAQDVEGMRRWWAGLARWHGPQPGRPRSFAELAERNQRSSIVAVLSEPYLRACSDDLRDAASKLTDGANLTVIGPGGRCPAIEDLVVPATAALRTAVGGSLLSLNVRAAAQVLEAARKNGDSPRRPFLSKLMAEATAAAPRHERRPVGTRMGDDEVRSFIRQSLAQGGTTSATPLLRKLRSLGLSCEQARFKALFGEVVAARALF
jgi:hypothetical protein